MPKEEKNRQKRFLMPLIILFSFLLPLLFLFLGIVIFRSSNKFSQTLNEGEKIKTEEKISPSQVLKDKRKYHNEKITLRGRASLSPVLCEKKECGNDPCCGCPDQRDLILQDVGTILKSSGKEKLVLKDIFTETSLCKRKALSCDYDCGDWTKGAIYDVSGVFYAEAPPSGWQKSLNYFFKLERKNLVRTINLGESFGNFLNDLGERFEKFRSSGQFVLP
jgi:hypothetical protein